VCSSVMSTVLWSSFGFNKGNNVLQAEQNRLLHIRAAPRRTCLHRRCSKGPGHQRRQRSDQRVHASCCQQSTVDSQSKRERFCSTTCSHDPPQKNLQFLTALINNAHIVTPQFVTALASATAPSSWPSEAAFQPKNVEVSYEVDLSPQPRRKTIFAKALLLFFTEKDVKQWSFLSAAGASIKEIATSVSPSAVASQYCALFERVYVFGTTATVNDPEWEKHMNDVHHIPPVVTYADQMHLAQLVPLPGTLSSSTSHCVRILSVFFQLLLQQRPPDRSMSNPIKL